MIWTPRHRNNRDAAAILRQRGGGILCPVQSFIYFILLPSPDWLMDIMLQVDSTKCISIVESGATLYNDGSRWWYDEDVHINLFQVSVPAPSIHSCVSIASCHSARGEEGQEQQIFIKYLSRANFTILPSLLICSRYLLICWYLFVCSFASISANVGDLLVPAASGRETLIILIMRPTPALCGLRCLLSSAIVDISALFYVG